MKVFALGSCRLIAPMQFLNRTGRLEFGNFEQRWYAHSAAEMVQRLDHMQGTKPLPDNVLQEVLDLDSCPTPIEQSTLSGDLPEVGLFEVSTRSGNWRGPYHLHSTLVSKRKITDCERRLATFDEMDDAILSLASRFKQLVLGCNIALKADLRTPDPNRMALNQRLKGLAAKHDNIVAVDPNELIDPVTPEKDIEDHNHFLSSLIPRVAELYLKAII